MAARDPWRTFGRCRYGLRRDDDLSRHVRVDGTEILDSAGCREGPREFIVGVERA